MKNTHFKLVEGFPGGSVGKKSTCNGEDQGSILGWEDPLEKGKATAPEYWPGEFQRCCKESDTTERPNTFLSFMYCFSWSCSCFLKISRNSVLSIKGGRD